MNTPIYDFVAQYAHKSGIRLHMPGHKGKGDTERLDITEIEGADSLYEASGIIYESEQNAGSLFGADTFYSAEGSSLSIRAAMYLISLYARSIGKKPSILAARNAHKAFISAVSLIDLQVNWIYPKCSSYLSCEACAEDIEAHLKECEEKPTALYITSPDYLGNILDIKAISNICHKYGVLLVVDNAHGAYLKFLPTSMHPIDLGADICCDSAHKTLPVLTGGAYLHISKNAPKIFKESAKEALSLFGSTSPSYLILASLDRANAYLSGDYKERLERFAGVIERIKERLKASGHTLHGSEPLKITLKTKPYGYYGYEMAKILEEKGIFPEFSDPDFLVLMLTPEISDMELFKMTHALVTTPQKAPIEEKSPDFFIPKVRMSPREAMLCEKETVELDRTLGKTLGAVTVGCPPAVPMLVMGEIIDENAIECFKYYGADRLRIIKEV